MADRPFEINVIVFPVAERKRMTVTADMGIDKFRSELVSTHAWAQYSLRLLFRGQILIDSRTIGEYGVQEDDTIHCALTELHNSQVTHDYDDLPQPMEGERRGLDRLLDFVGPEEVMFNRTMLANLLIEDDREQGRAAGTIDPERLIQFEELFLSDRLDTTPDVDDLTLRDAFQRVQQRLNSSGVDPLIDFTADQDRPLMPEFLLGFILGATLGLASLLFLAPKQIHFMRRIGIGLGLCTVVFFSTGYMVASLLVSGLTTLLS